MSTPSRFPLLTGNVDNRDEIITTLEAENQELRDAVQHLEVTLAQEKSRNGRAIAKLRQQLTPLYHALQTVFGDMDDISPATGQSAASPSGSKWDAIKQKMPPRHRELVDLLLLQGGMKRTQIAAALKMDYSNCTKNVIGALKSAGWLVENGGLIQLKEL